MAERDLYVEKARARMDQWNADIAKLQAKAVEAEVDARIEYEKQIARLRIQRDEAEVKLKEMREASDDAWTDVKAGFDKAWDDMASAYEKARSRFR